MTATEGVLWMVVRMDTHGTNFIMQDGCSEEAARQFLANLLARQLKVHHQHYSIYRYTASTRAVLIAQLGIS